MESTKLAPTTEPAKINWKESLINLLQQCGYSNRNDYLKHTTLSRRTGDYLEKITITDGFTSYWVKNIFSTQEAFVKTFLPHVNHAASIDLMRKYGVFNATEKSIKVLIGEDLFTTLGNALNPAL